MVPYLIDWFAGNARILPWREDPQPYYVWISEIMLQQTRVEAVKGYFERFIRELPDLHALAVVPEEKLLKLWEGLGYYNRARNLKKAAIQIEQKYGGKLPETKEELMTLAGIGPYTAGAISSIAYGQPAAAVDGNVLRVMMRLRASREDITKESVKRELAQTLEAVMPPECPGTFNQAMMELGAMVCLPNGRPLCEKCPVMHLCRGFHQGIMMVLPVKQDKKPRRIEERTILVIESEEGVLLRKRPASGLLAGLWEYPSLEGFASYESVEELMLQQGFHVREISRLQEAKHIFSHIEWHMTGFYVAVEKNRRLAEEKAVYFPENGVISQQADKGKPLCPEGVWITRRQLQEDYSMPAAFEAYRLRESD